MNVGLIWAQTLFRPVVMGHRRWDSLAPRSRPLSGRRNIVVTRDPRRAANGAERAGSIAQALELAAEPSEPAPTTLSVTEADSTADGDTYRVSCPPGP